MEGASKSKQMRSTSLTFPKVNRQHHASGLPRPSLAKGEARQRPMSAVCLTLQEVHSNICPSAIPRLNLRSAALRSLQFTHSHHIYSLINNFGHLKYSPTEIPPSTLAFCMCYQRTHTEEATEPGNLKLLLAYATCIRGVNPMMMGRFSMPSKEQHSQGEESQHHV